MNTPEEAQLQGQLNQMLENNLSSVRIEEKTKGVIVWEVKAKHQDPIKALEASMKIFDELQRKYGNNPV